jgi:hypothetical protein
MTAAATRDVVSLIFVLLSRSDSPFGCGIPPGERHAGGLYDRIRFSSM